MMTTSTRAAALFLGGMLAFGCATGSGRGPRPAGDARVAGPGELTSVGERQRLETISTARAGAPLDGGYHIGPDDLLDVRIPDLLDWGNRLPPPVPAVTAGAALPTVAEAPVFQQGVRVDAHGDITLPLLGTVPAAGRTPTALEQEIRQRLIAAGLLRNPQVSVQVVEHRSQVVAVVGSVERPGLYPLTRPGATLSDLIWAAGGPNKDAGRVVLFVPKGAARMAGGKPGVAVASNEGIRIDLDGLLQASDTSASDPPVEPGDLINVAPAGNVQVDGWVDKPGSYPVTRSLTVTGAVAAAGGALFPADLSRVTIKRSLGPEDQRHFTIDLQRITEGRAPDVPIADGDVVHLPASAARIVPYGAWALVQSLVHIGGTVAIF